MPIMRTDIERALDELTSQEEGMRFQGLAVVLGKQRWSELVAHPRKNDLGLDAYAPASETPERVGKGLAASITPTRAKISADAETAKKHYPDLQKLLFVTPAPIVKAKQREWEEAIRNNHHLELLIIEREEIITLLMMPANASLSNRFLHLDIDSEPEIAELIARTRRAAADVSATWARRLGGHPLVPLTIVHLAPDGAESTEQLSLENVRRLLSDSSRVVLEGAGGCGKTTTLIQLAQRVTTIGTPLMVDLPAWQPVEKVGPGLDGSGHVLYTACMAMGKRPGARQAVPMWVHSEDLPTSDGHPFFERLNRILEESGFDAFVEGLCSRFYAERLGRPSLRPGRYFRLLFIGFFEGVSSERGIAWRVADSLSLRSFLGLDLTEAAPNHSTLSRTRRRIDEETHEAVFTWVLDRAAEAGLVRGKTIGIDATTLEANAAMRSIERRDTGESYDAFLQGLAEASGIATPTRAELARFDRSRKNKASNKDWQSPQDPDAKIAKMKDGRTHLAHKVEHGVDMDTGAIVAVTVQDASEGDTATLPDTLTKASEQVEAVQPDGREVEEVVADKGYHSDATLVALEELEVRSYISEPERGPASVAGQADGRDAAGEASCAEGAVWEPPSYSWSSGAPSATAAWRAGRASVRSPV